MARTEKPVLPIYDTITLIGVGLIGSSMAHAIRRGGLARRIIGCVHRPETKARVDDLKLVDECMTDPAKAVADADLVVLATPVGTFSAVARKIGPFVKPGATVTDVGSVKEVVLKEVGPHMKPDVHLIPGHPVAGTEHSGPDAGFADLFDNRWCILTPPSNTDPVVLERLKAFWSGCGCKLEIMDARHHDLVLAITSHVPHLIAYNIVGTAADLEAVTNSEVIKYSAGGFRDFTRIAASDPTMWRDVFLNNRDAVLEMLGRFGEDLTALQRAIRWGDGDTLYKLFTETRDIRRQIIDAGQETAKPDFGRHNGRSPDK